MAPSRVRQRTLMLPSFMRFAMSGSTHAFTLGCSSASRSTIVTSAPARQLSSAASTPELPPPTITTFWRQWRWPSVK